MLPTCLWKAIYNLAKHSESVLLGRFVYQIIVFYSRYRDIVTPSIHVREFVSISQPKNPLSENAAPDIDVFIPCHSKDVVYLDLVIEAARTNVLNPIAQIILVTPESNIRNLSRFAGECIIHTDEEFIPNELNSLVAQKIPFKRQGWVRQQIVKFLGVIRSNSIASLIIDADTILLSKRTWIDRKGRQLLCIANEYHQPYKRHQSRFFNQNSQPFSFVTHHQLMQRQHVVKMFDSTGHGLSDWLLAADFREFSGLSEYDSYGEWIINNEPSCIVLGKWNNYQELPNSKKVPTLMELSERYMGFDSISLHSYLKPIS